MGTNLSMPGEKWVQDPLAAIGNMITKTLDARGNKGTKNTRCQGRYGHKKTINAKRNTSRKPWMPGEIWAQKP